MKYSLTAAAIVAATFSTTASAAEAAQAVPAHNTNPHLGDVSHEPTMYNLYTYSEPGYRGKGARLEPHECTSLRNNSIKAQSIQFNGNNCCFFFPKDDCSNLHAGQRIVGNVPDVSVWGFPHGVGAVKCLSQAACSVIKHQACDLDRHCDRYAEQAKCPFVPSCHAYDPVHPADWSQFVLPPVAVDAETGYVFHANPVRERFHVTGDGEVVNLQAASGVSPLEHHRHQLEAAANGHGATLPPPVTPIRPVRVLQPGQGGSDDYEHGAVGRRPGLPYKAAKSADKAAKKEAKKKYKEEMKKYKQDVKQVKKLERLLEEEEAYYDAYYGYDDYDDDYDY